MSTLPAKTILKDDPRFAETPDFRELRKRGLEHVAALSGGLWTDHNLHDPGITLLELMCYALTDLGYRTSLDEAELFAPAETGGEDGNFYTPAEILTNNPVTILDYRKMLVDIPGVRNAWIEKVEGQEVPLSYKKTTEEDCGPRQLKTTPATEDDHAELLLDGLYRVLLDIDPLLTGEDDDCRVGGNTFAGTLAEVKRRLHAHRNLCEDFLEIVVLGDEEIRFCLDLDLAPKADPAEVLTEVFEAIEDFLSPRVRFAGLEELLKEKKSIETIFRGRPYLPAYEAVYGVKALSHGFVDTEQLEAMPRRREIHTSDLYRVIMEVPGVRAIRELKIANFLKGRPQTDGEEWILPLTPNHRPLFAPRGGVYKFHKGNLRVPFNATGVIDRFQRRLADYRKTAYDHADLDRAVPYGRHRADLGNYYSVQHELPAVYGIGEGELSRDATAERRAQVLQLRGFLSFFDQLMANYCYQLFNTRQLYSWLPGVTKTSFSKPVEGAPGASELLRFKAATQSGTTTATIVYSLTAYDHPLNRDQAMASLQNEFNQLTLVELKDRVRFSTNPNGRYYFEITDARGRAILRGSQDYRLEDTAATAGESATLQLLAKGGDEANYRPDNYPAEHQYGFTILDGPVDQIAFLDAIAESPATFATRRNEVLDQLLARFNEQFTDYVLLMYALNQSAPDPLKIIADKERFLANYPAISRERGKGFDYREPGLPGNISGLEQRVGSLIGLDINDHPTLNPFGVHLREQKSYLVWTDHRGRVLLRSATAYPSGTELAEIKSSLLERLADPAAYRRHDCPADSIYRYSLVDEAGEPLANFPASFPDAESRETNLDCTLAYFTGLVTRRRRKHGIRLAFLSEKQGYFFALTAADEETVYLKTAAIYADEAAAWSAGLALLTAARISTAYRPTLVAGQYGFDLVGHDAEQIGEHPQSYPTEAERDAIMTEVQAYYADRNFDYRPQQTRSRFFWRVCAGNAGPELKGLMPFAEGASALRHWETTLAQLGDDVRMRVNHRAEADYRVELRREGGLLLAESLAYPDQDVARTALEKLRVHLATAGDETAEVVEETGDWWFELGLEGEVVLRSENRYPDKPTMDRAFLLFTKIASEEENYREIPDPDGCLYGFGVRDEDGLVARYPGFLPEAEALKLRERVRQHFEENAVGCRLGHQEFRWTYRLRWEDCAGDCADLLLSEGDGWDTEEDARKAASALLTKLRRANALEDWQNGTAFTFGVSRAGVPLAAHPREYATTQERDAVIADAKAYLKDYFDLCDKKKDGFSPEPMLYVHCKSRPACCPEEVETDDPATDIPKLAPGEDCVLSAFQLRKENAALAYHPGRLCSVAEREALKERIFSASSKGMLERYEHFEARPQVQGKVEQQGDGPLKQVNGTEWTFHLYAPDDGQEWLRSTACYPDRDAAGRAYNLLLELLANPNNYRPDDRPEAGIYRLRIVETLLEGSVAYADQVAGIYCPVICPAEYPLADYTVRKIVAKDVAEGAGEDQGETEYSIEERLVPVRSSCPEEEMNATLITPKAWNEGLQTFLIEGTSPENYYDFLDGDQDCRHGFRVVRPGYRLARSPRESHTPAEREQLLRWLYQYAVCGPQKNSAPYDLCYRIGGDEYRAALSTLHDEEHWIATARFAEPGGVDAYWLDNNIHLLNLAQQPDFYQVRRETPGPDGVVRYRLLLLNEEQEVVLESPLTYTRDELAAAVRVRIRVARSFPLYLTEIDGKTQYGFQCFSLEDLPEFRNSVDRHCPPTFHAPAAAPENTEEETIVRNGILELNVHVPGEVIWESSEDYDDKDEAREAFICFLRLLTDRRNLQRIQLTDCNLFGLELTRPDYVLAEHPRRYAGPTGLAEAKARVLACVNSEGLRLLEHLLLRPHSTGDRTIPNICPAPPLAAEVNQIGCPDHERWLRPTTENPVEPASTELLYVPGADPYSHWATVVLPYWPHRFQNINFRAFFEDSLRREAPAHVALKICWLDPFQMREFELRHQRWLTTRGDSGNCARSAALNDLIDFLAGMTSVYPPARLQNADCNAGGVTEAGSVLLGATQLS